MLIETPAICNMYSGFESLDRNFLVFFCFNKLAVHFGCWQYSFYDYLPCHRHNNARKFYLDLWRSCKGETENPDYVLFFGLLPTKLRMIDLAWLEMDLNCQFSKNFFTRKIRGLPWESEEDDDSSSLSSLSDYFWILQNSVLVVTSLLDHLIPTKSVATDHRLAP